MSTEYDPRILQALRDSGYGDGVRTASGLDLRRTDGTRVMLSGHKALFCRDGMWRPFNVEEILTVGVAELESRVRIIVNKDGEEDRTGYSLVARQLTFY